MIFIVLNIKVIKEEGMSLMEYVGSTDGVVSLETPLDRYREIKKM